MRRFQEDAQVFLTYHSNALEGNSLTLRETQMVIAYGITIHGHPLREYLVASNYARANDSVILHSLVMDKMLEARGQFCTVPVYKRGSNMTPSLAHEVKGLMDKWVTWMYGEGVARDPVIDLYDFCHLHGQVARRTRDLYFPRSHFDNAAGCEAFVGTLRSLLERVSLHADVPGLLTHWRWFGEWSLGCIGVLSDWLVETVDALYKQGNTTVTIDASRKHALPPGLRARMEREARAGESKIDQAKARSEQELRQLLGKPGPVPWTVPTEVPHSNGASAFKPLAATYAGVHGHTRVERGAARGAVGDRVEVRPAPGCTFSGIVVHVPLKRFQEKVG